MYHPDDHSTHARVFAYGLRKVVTLRGPGSWAAHLQKLLLERSEEFRAVWEEHEIGVEHHDVKRFVHPEVGILGTQELDAAVLGR